MPELCPHRTQDALVYKVICSPQFHSGRLLAAKNIKDRLTPVLPSHLSQSLLGLNPSSTLFQISNDLADTHSSILHNFSEEVGFFDINLGLEFSPQSILSGAFLFHPSLSPLDPKDRDDIFEFITDFSFQHSFPFFNVNDTVLLRGKLN